MITPSRLPATLVSAVLTALVCLAVHPVSAASERGTTAPLDAQRVADIARMLPEQPGGPVPPITDRAAWSTMAASPMFSGFVPTAQKVLASPLPAVSDDLFLEYSRNGVRRNYERAEQQRRERLAPLVLAECIENRGRFLPAIDELVTTLCAERTWVLPAHDGKLTNYKGTVITVDLWSSALAWDLALTDYLLADRMPADTRKRLRAEIQRKVLQPYFDMIHLRRTVDWWLVGTNNWNAVCLAGVTGAALTLAESRQARAEAVAAAEQYSRNFLSGFTPDGYCSEGLGYWNYGFGNFALLSETIRTATSGKVDLMAQPTATMPALFGRRIQIINGVAPAFADCSVEAHPDSNLQWLINARFGRTSNGASPRAGGSIAETFVYYLAARTPAPRIKMPVDPANEQLRTWFDKAGILICRPAAESTSQFAVAVKGGHNGEHHNHNDIGSFVVVCGNTPVLLDPGSEVYTKRTFSSARYESKMLNSFGHPVPVPVGVLQRTGRSAAARVLQADFSDSRDTLGLDLSSGYKNPAVKQLERTFAYSREGTGSLTVTDRVQFSAPQTFETALLTRGKFEKTSGSALRVTDGKESVMVTIDTGGVPYEISSVRIVENAAVKPTRIAVKLAQPVTSATVTMTITP